MRSEQPWQLARVAAQQNRVAGCTLRTRSAELLVEVTCVEIVADDGYRVSSVTDRLVATDDACDYGLQYSRTGDCVKTSVKAHIDHYRDHASRDPLLATLLRLVKRWRYWQDLKGIQSFHLELVLSYLVDRNSAARGVEEGLRRFFLFVARDLDRGVAFDDADPSTFTDPIVVVDPANADNNVAARITRDEHDAFVAAANEALVTLTVAQGLPGKSETVTAWKEPCRLPAPMREPPPRSHSRWSRSS